MKTLLIIPAHAAARDAHGTHHDLLGGMSIIQQVWEQVCDRVPADCVVATDDEQIADTVEAFEGNVILTFGTHHSDVSRCGEVLDRTERVEREEYDVVICMPCGDPLIEPQQVRQLIASFADPAVQAAYLGNTEGVYALRSNTLREICTLPIGQQQHWQQAGYNILEIN